MDSPAYTEADLDAMITAIHGGVFEQPYWGGFLAAIRTLTHSDYASMSFRRADARYKDVTVMRLGDAIGNHDHEVAEIVRRLKLPYASLERHRPYSLREIANLVDSDSSDYLTYLNAHKFVDTCVIRMEVPDGGQLWLTIGSYENLYPAWVGDVLRRAAPHLSIAASTLARLESERMRADIASNAVLKLNFGWLTFDAQARVVEIDPGLEALFRKAPSLAGCRPGQVMPVRRAGDCDIVKLLAATANEPAFRPRALHLVDEPWLDMLIVPIRYRAISGGITPVAVGYVHGAGAASAERCDQLIQLFGLTASEARLALALSQGRKIAEAGRELGLTLETARNYSKRIYAKTGTRGQADLIRIILTSVIALS